MNEKTITENANKYFKENEDKLKTVEKRPFNLWQTKRVLCRKCARMIARHIEQGVPQENERKENYCVYCQKRLEKIWS